MKQEIPLNTKTPLWFQQWHDAHYKPLRDTVKSNSRWIYIIIAAVIVAGAANNSNFDIISKVVQAFVAK